MDRRAGGWCRKVPIVGYLVYLDHLTLSDYLAQPSASTVLHVGYLQCGSGVVHAAVLCAGRFSTPAARIQ